MGLNDIVPEDVADGDGDDSGKDYPVGEVKSRKDIENLTCSKKWWAHCVASANPHLFEFSVDDRTLEEKKCILQMLDMVIEDEVPGLKASGDQQRNAKEARDKVMEKIGN